MKSKCLVGLLLFSLLGSQSIAQYEYTITKVNSENGLPQNSIKGLHFDNAGFLWIATENGLLRYDGYLFKTFSSHSDTPINNRIIRMNTNPDNRLYVIDVNGTMAEISNGKLNVLHKGSYNHPVYPVISLGSQLPSSLFRKFYPASPLFNKEDTVLENIIAISENKFFVVYDKVIDLFKDQELQHEIKFPSEKKHEVFTINGQLFAFIYSSGFYHLDLKNRKWIPARNETGFRNLKGVDLNWENHDKLPFAAVNDRLYQLDFTGNKLVAYRVIDSLGIHSNITSVVEDSVTKQYFIGTENEGFFIYRRKIFKTLLSDGQKKSYYGQLPLNDNYILTNRGDIIGRGSGKPLRGPIERFSNYIIRDAGNNLFYASGDSVFKYSVMDKKSHLLFVDRKSEMIALDYYKDTLWMINSNGIHYDVKGKNFTSIHFAANQNNIPYIVERVSADKVLFGNCMGLFSCQLETRKIDTILFYPQRCVRAIWRYNDKIFIGTYGEGWKIWKGNKIYNMPLDQKGYLLYSHCFIKDEANYLWIPTNNGLFQYYLPDIENFLDGRSSALFNYYYSKADGIESTEFNGGCFPCYAKLKNGYYSLPNLSGLVWFKPGETELNHNANGIYIDKIEVNNQQIPVRNKDLTLPGSTKLLRIELSSPFFGDQMNYPIEYRTFGIDTTWKPLNRFISAVRYTTLPAGKYLLQLRKPMGFGKPWLVSSFNFRIKAAWYATPVMITGWIVLLILLMLLIVRLRVSQLKKAKRELQKLVDQKVVEIKDANAKLSRNLEILQKYQQELIKRDLVQSRFIKIISHDIIGPLRFMTMTTSQIYKQKDVVDKQYLLDSLSDIKKTSEDMLALTIDILSWINYQKENVHLTYEQFNLYPLIQGKMAMFERVAKTRGIQLQVNCPEPLFVQNDINIIKIILQNLLSNSLKFTSIGSVVVSAGIKADNYYLEVRDTGKGMSHAQVKNLLGEGFVQATADAENRKGYGIGFMIIRELVALSHGVIHIDSEIGKGSCIQIEWPLEIQPKAPGDNEDLTGTVIVEDPGVNTIE